MDIPVYEMTLSLIDLNRLEKVETIHCEGWLGLFPSFIFTNDLVKINGFMFIIERVEEKDERVFVDFRKV